MWRCFVCAIPVAACTSAGERPEFVEFQARASVLDAQLDVTVDAYDLAPSAAQMDLADANVSARFRGQTVELAFDPYSLDSAYRAVLELADPIDADEAITFTLGEGDTSVDVTATFAPDFQLVPPGDAKAGAPVDLAWTPPSTDEMAWSGRGCAGDFDGPVPIDTGVLEFPAVVFGTQQDGCDVELVMTRSRTTLPTSAFAYVSVVTERPHTINFTVAR